MATEHSPSEAAGGSLADAVKLTIYLTDLGNFPVVINEFLAADAIRQVPGSVDAAFVPPSAEPFRASTLSANARDVAF